MLDEEEIAAGFWGEKVFSSVTLILGAVKEPQGRLWKGTEELKVGFEPIREQAKGVRNHSVAQLQEQASCMSYQNPLCHCMLGKTCTTKCIFPCVFTDNREMWIKSGTGATSFTKKNQRYFLSSTFSSSEISWESSLGRDPSEFKEGCGFKHSCYSCAQAQGSLMAAKSLKSVNRFCVL